VIGFGYFSASMARQFSRSPFKQCVLLKWRSQPAIAPNPRESYEDEWVGKMMNYNPEKHHRRSIRLKGYDYTAPSAYFITICTHHRHHLFGAINRGALQLSP
jgi:hypothetical protein